MGNWDTAGGDDRIRLGPKKTKKNKAGAAAFGAKMSAIGRDVGGDKGSEKKKRQF